MKYLINYQHQLKEIVKQHNQLQLKGESYYYQFNDKVLEIMEYIAKRENITIDKVESDFQEIDLKNWIDYNKKPNFTTSYFYQVAKKYSSQLAMIWLLHHKDQKVQTKELDFQARIITLIHNNEFKNSNVDWNDFEEEMSTLLSASEYWYGDYLPLENAETIINKKGYRE